MENVPSTQNLSTSLPAPWIDRLFARFGALYGTRFAQAMVGQDIVVVKELWAQELSGYGGADLRGGLDRLCKEYPSWPPTLYEFAALCRASIKPEAHVALPHPKPDTAAVNPRIVALTATLAGKRNNPLAWADKLKARHAAGDKTVDPYALRMAMDAERIAAGGLPRAA